MTAPNYLDQLLTRREVGEIVGLKKNALAKALKAPGAPPAIMLNARVLRYRRGDVESWLRRRAMPATPIEPPPPRQTPPPRRLGRPRKHTIAEQTA